MDCRGVTYPRFTLPYRFIFHPRTNLSTSQEMAAHKADLPLGKKETA